MTRRRQGRGRIRRRPVAVSVTFTALVIALVPLLTLGVTAGIAQQRVLTERVSDDLGALADAQAARVSLLGAAATDGVRLVASRTQLRVDLAEVVAGERTDLGRIVDILHDARDATSGLRQVAVTDPAGRVIATTDGDALPDLSPTQAAQLAADPDTVRSRIVPGPHGNRWLATTALVLDDAVIGAAITEFDLAGVAEVTRRSATDAPCLVTTLFHRDEAGEPAFLVPPVTTCGTEPSVDTALLDATDVTAAAAALAGDERLLTDTTDHLGRAVFAATRYLDELDWGLQVTVERDVLLAPVTDATRMVAIAVLGAALLAVVLAGLLARRLSRPLNELRQIAVAVRSGARDVRADADATGELGDLAAAVNEMTTAVHAHETELQRRYDDLEVLTHAMAHDLKGPLTSIRGGLQLVDTGRVTAPEDVQRVVDMALSATTRMQRLIDDLLALSRALGAPLTLQPVDLEVVVDRAAEQLGLADVVERDELPTVAGDTVLLDQVVTNLLTNAATYVADDTTPRVVVSADVSDQGVVLHVDDNGVGIPPDERDTVLEPFVRGGGGRGHPGSGLGLSIVARVAERHGGTVGIDDSPHGGTRISVSLSTVGRVV